MVFLASLFCLSFLFHPVLPVGDDYILKLKRKKCLSNHSNLLQMTTLRMVLEKGCDSKNYIYKPLKWGVLQVLNPYNVQ